MRACHGLPKHASCAHGDRGLSGPFPFFFACGYRMDVCMYVCMYVCAVVVVIVAVVV